MPLKKEREQFETSLSSPKTKSAEAYERGERPHDRGRGVTTIIMVYQGQGRFSGLYEGDLENIAEMYCSIANMCDTTPGENANTCR